MPGNILWKFILSALIVGWAILNLVPLNDTPFETYFEEHSSGGDNAELLGNLLTNARESLDSGESPSFFIALRDTANAQEIDLSQFFPEIRMERSLRNIEKRNNILMDELLQRSKSNLQFGLDLRGGVAFTLEVQESGNAEVDEAQRTQELSKAIEIIRSRVNGLGVSEPSIRPVGNNRIEVQLPGLSTKDNPEAVDSLQKPARLEFKRVHATQRPMGPNDPNVPPGFEIKMLEQENPGEEPTVEYLYIKRVPEMTGESIAEAFPSVDQFGRYRINMRFTGEGADRFAEVTREIAAEGRGNRLGRLAIVLDNQLYSAPTVREEISGGSAEISGRFTQREAFELANVLNNPLDLPLEIAEMYEVGPTLASDAVLSGRNAAILGASLVGIFMVGYYLVAGIVAMASVVLNVLVVLGVLSSFGATLTLPGISALVLTIGMAVDANILIFERMREELKSGKSLKASLLGGYDKALSTIIDANVTTLITSGILIWLGTGPVKGFGVTLAIGIGATLFSSLIVSRFLLDFLVHSNTVTKLLTYGISGESKIPFLRYRKVAFASSWCIVLIGVVVVFGKGDSIYGIDFVGGDELTFHFEERPDPQQISDIASDLGIGETLSNFQSPIGDATQEILKVQTEFGRGEELAAALIERLPQDDIALIGESRIGPTVGKEIQWNAFLSVICALAGMLLYIAFRFEVGYGVGAVVATIHDVAMTIGIFVLFDRQFTAPMVAAVLMIVGYSINDTIVVFDRIREELDLNPNLTLAKVINLAINRTLSRTILTSASTLMAVISLLIFGTGIVSDFALTFLVGILTGTFSSIFIASPVFFWWHKGDRKHVESQKELLPKYEWETGAKKDNAAGN